MKQIFALNYYIYLPIILRKVKWENWRHVYVVYLVRIAHLYASEPMKTL